MNEEIAIELVKQVSLINTNLDLIVKELKLIARGDLK